MRKRPAKKKDDEQQDFLSSLYRFGSSEVEIHTREGLTVFAVRGKYSTNLFQQLTRLLSRARGTVGLELRNLTGINMSIVGLLENMARKFRAQGGDLVILNPRTQLLDLLRLSNTETTFKIAEAEHLLPRLKTSSTKYLAPRKKGAKPLIETDLASEKRILHFQRDLSKAVTFERTMDTAEERQRKLLPADVPHIDGYDFAVRYNPCEKVGGDFYDFVRLDKFRWGIAIADVSGHGMLAALYMGMLKMVLRIRAQEYDAPGDLLKQVNADLTPYLDKSSFITAFYGVLETRTRLFRFARAGHNFPIFFNTYSNEAPKEVDSPGIVIGMDRGTTFNTILKEQTVKLRPGDSIFLYTDGLVEVKNRLDEEWGNERLLKFLKNANAMKSKNILNELEKQIEEYSGTKDLEDDLTIICVGVKS
jgi:serine phosphatase RsbU (regulator of sigma subunit)/anti-anti-sigma regulatory factor